MNKILLTFAGVMFILVSCGESKKEDSKKEVQETKEVIQENNSSTATEVSLLEKGEKLFNEKTCVSCHHIDKKIVGPSIKNIASVYREKNGDLMQFLKGKTDPIVETDPGQIAIMKANLDGFVKDLSDEQLQALENYILHAE